MADDEIKLGAVHRYLSIYLVAGVSGLDLALKSQKTSSITECDSNSLETSTMDHGLQT